VVRASRLHIERPLEHEWTTPQPLTAAKESNHEWTRMNTNQNSIS
jgi:hypothetical protein